MRLTSYSDYSLRLLMFAAVKQGGLVTVPAAAQAYGISRNHLMKVAHDLGRHGYLETVRGRGGGLRLARAPEKINLGALLRHTEEHFHIVECFAPGADGCAITRCCRLKGMLGEATAAFLAVMDKYTLADLTGRNPALARRLLAA
jgi:Rrf2 family nitric oxide-sensitive transcriptional repressor